MKSLLISSPMTCNVTIMSLVDLPAGRLQPPDQNNTTQVQPAQTKAASAKEGEQSHGS
jgi:hypothetical protein